MTDDNWSAPVPGALAKPTDLVICNGLHALVLAVIDHPAGGEYGPLVTRQVITTRGERIFGHAPGDRYRGTEISAFAPEGVSFEPTHHEGNQA